MENLMFENNVGNPSERNSQCIGNCVCGGGGAIAPFVNLDPPLPTKLVPWSLHITVGLPFRDINLRRQATNLIERSESQL